METWHLFVQELAWPAVTVGLLVWFRGPLTAVATALAERLVAGAPLRLPGGFEIGPVPPRPLDDAKTVEEAGAKLKERLLTVDTAPLLASAGRQWITPYDRFRTVSSLLNDI
jgi:hypothetical protein